MKRFSPDHVMRTACAFAASSNAAHWHLFSGLIRSALLDAHIMSELRWAHVADSAQTLTPSQIIEFRDAVAAQLAIGVRTSRRQERPSRFIIDEQQVQP